MYQPSSKLCNIPGDVLEVIALETTLLDPLGPPSDLIPLLQTCKHIYHTLSMQSRPSLYSRIFLSKFDVRPAYRRFGRYTMTSSGFAAELRCYSSTLRRIRQGDIYADTVLDDFWTSLFMLVESDGRNEAHLLEWAGLKGFVDRFVRVRLWEGQEGHNGWPAESIINALALWLMWLTTDEETLMSESPDSRQEIMGLIRPYVVAPMRYPSFHAPDNHFDLPLDETELSGQFPYTHRTPHGLYPPYRKPSEICSRRSHFINLKIAPPLVSVAAKLLYFARSEATPYDIPSALPVNRADAIARGLTNATPTQQDYIEFNQHKGARVVPKGDWDWYSKLKDEEKKLEDEAVWKRTLKAKSVMWDNDWQRWNYCWDPWVYPSLKSAVYTYGSLDGVWKGRMLIPDSGEYFSLVTTANYAAHLPWMITLPICMRLREHHCINPEFPVICGGSTEDTTDDGVRNGWFPQVSVHESNGIVRVEDQVHGFRSHYETYVEGKPNSHNPNTCNLCIARQEDEEESFRTRVRELTRISSGTESPDPSDAPSQEKHEGSRSDQEVRRHWDAQSPSARHKSLGPSASAAPSLNMDDTPSGMLSDDLNHMRKELSAAMGSNVDDVLDVEMANSESGVSAEFEEYVEHVCSGIQDIIITGETPTRHGQAWDYFRFYGRVRRWDGLVALVRVPIHVPEHGIAIFRGYLIGGQNFVGNWRPYTSNAHAIPLEGPFIASRMENDSIA